METETGKFAKVTRYKEVAPMPGGGRFRQPSVAALSADADVLEKTGKIHFVADLAREYGFTDVDGKAIPRFRPFD